MLIVREDLARMSKLTDDERYVNSYMTATLKWVDSLIESGNYIAGEPLQVRGRYVGKDQILSDGPFIEANEGVSGYMITILLDSKVIIIQDLMAAPVHLPLALCHCILESLRATADDGWTRCSSLIL